jgi:hypothetical protein
MHRKHAALPLAAALAFSLSACGEDTDKTTSSTYGSDTARTAQRTPSWVPGERPGARGNPSGMSDASPSNPDSSDNRPDEKEQPFGQGSPQTSMTGADTPSVAGTSNENKAEGPGYNRGG